MIAARVHSRGMTLVELMASMAVGLILLLLAVALLGSTGAGYGRINGSIGSEREARGAISQLTSDLSGGCFHKKSILETSSSSRLGFLSLQPATAQTEARRIGDLCAIHYSIKDLMIGDQTVRCLMRGSRDSGETFNALRDDCVDSLFSERVDLDEPIAFGVISFLARPQTRDASGTWIDWQNHGELGPEVLRVKLVFARRELASKLKKSRDWDEVGGRDCRASKEIEVYETSIRFGNHANP